MPGPSAALHQWARTSASLGSTDKLFIAVYAAMPNWVKWGKLLGMYLQHTQLDPVGIATWHRIDQVARHCACWAVARWLVRTALGGGGALLRVINNGGFSNPFLGISSVLTIKVMTM